MYLMVGNIFFDEPIQLLFLSENYAITSDVVLRFNLKRNQGTFLKQFALYLEINNAILIPLFLL